MKTNKYFFLPLERRDFTGLPLVGEYVVPGVTRVSDYGATCSTMKNMSKGYQHYTVNHFLHFVDPEPVAFKNTIQSL